MPKYQGHQKRTIKHVIEDFNQNPQKAGLIAGNLLVAGSLIVPALSGHFDPLLLDNLPIATPEIVGQGALVLAKALFTGAVTYPTYKNIRHIIPPKDAGYYQERLWEADIRTPVLKRPPLIVTIYPNKDNPDATTWELEGLGLIKEKYDRFMPNIIQALEASDGLYEWKKHKDKKRNVIQSLLAYIGLIGEKGYSERILVHTIAADKNPLQQIHVWNDRFMSEDNATLVLGVDMLNRIVSVNLSKIPHQLYGGSTSSGKSQMQLLVEKQAIMKKWAVIKIDMKGGVDIPREWHDKCYIVTDVDSVIEMLSSLMKELERRKGLLSSAGCKNVDEYNTITEAALPRILISCDEVGQLLDQTGRSKSDKEKISIITSFLSTIASQGRAFSMNLLISTQRPSVDVVPGHIKSNIDFRACGRADSILSQIILDSPIANEKIPKDAQGLFLTNNGKLFKAFLLDDYDVSGVGGGGSDG